MNEQKEENQKKEEKSKFSVGPSSLIWRILGHSILSTVLAYLIIMFCFVSVGPSPWWHKTQSLIGASLVILVVDAIFSLLFSLKHPRRQKVFWTLFVSWLVIVFVIIFIISSNYDQHSYFEQSII